MSSDWVQALLGGFLIGIAVSLMLLWNGRVTGISGIVYGLFCPKKGDIQWRFQFVLGLGLGGLVLFALAPKTLENTLSQPTWAPVVAGLLVGFGTVLGSGCTSGHGVCGISRMSPRSLVATLIFMGAGIGAVYLFRILGVTA